MHRPRTTSFVLLASMLLPLGLLVGCGGGGEERRIIDRFFTASRVRDASTLANIAAVTFSPTEHGTVQSFSVTDPGEEQRRALRLRDLARALDEARAVDEEFNARRKEYQDANLEAIERVLKAERENRDVAARDRDVQEAWTRWREETIENARKVSDARAALADERAIPEASVYNPQEPIDVTQFDGELITREVAIRARVRQPDGSEAEQDMVVVLQRARLTDGPDGREIEGRWIVTGVS